jgi:hypothetical protein
MVNAKEAPATHTEKWEKSLGAHDHYKGIADPFPGACARVCVCVCVCVCPVSFFGLWEWSNRVKWNITEKHRSTLHS